MSGRLAIIFKVLECEIKEINILSGYPTMRKTPSSKIYFRLSKGVLCNVQKACLEEKFLQKHKKRKKKEEERRRHASKMLFIIRKEEEYLVLFQRRFNEEGIKMR